VGGDYQGKNPDVQNAERAYVGPGANIRADATSEGDGGKVVVWADGDTRYYGEISARGGPEGGNGGFVEVSGKRDLDFRGKVNVSAPQGEGGRVLLDPQNIVLNTTTQPSPPNNAIGSPDVPFADPPDPGTYTIQIADVTGYAELFLQATNDITVSNILTMGAGNTIRFEADNNITINATVNTTGTPSTARPSITLTADADGSGAGTLAINAALNSDIGGISLSGASITGAGAINSTGSAAQNGGDITINATGAISLAGAITANGGTAAGAIGRNAGNVSIAGAGITTAAITANGTGGAGGFAGGAGGAIQLDSTNGISTGALAASGGNAGAGSASGGSGGTIAVSNTTAGGVTTGNLTARAGAATGTALSSAGLISVTNDAAGAVLQTGTVDTRGNFNGAGGAVTLASQGALQFNAGASILASGGAARAGTSGQNGGAVTLTGDTVTTSGVMTASGSAGNGADMSGGNAGSIMVTANGSIDISAGALTAAGGNAGGGNADGGSGGAVTLDAGAASTITLANIATTGGNRFGTGTAGAGGNITMADAALLGASTTITATGGSGGVGTGGDVTFSGTLDSSGASRTLAVNTNGATAFGDAVGSTLALTLLTTNATGTTSIGGDVTTTGAQTYGDAVTLTANATLTGTNPTFSSTVNGGGMDLRLDFSGTTTINGANFSNINNLATGNGGTTRLTGAITTSGTQSYGDAVTLTGSTTLASTGNQAIAFGGTVDGARTLAVNTAGDTTFSGVVGGATPLTGLTTDAGGTTSIGANISTSNAPVSLRDAVTLAGPSTISSGTGAVTFGSTLDGANALMVNSTGATTFSAAVGGATPLASLTTNAGGTTAIDGGSVTTGGAQSYNDATTLGGATTLQTTGGGDVSAAGAVTAIAGTLTLDTGSGAVTFDNVANNFGTVAITSGGAVSLVDANALTLAGGSIDTLQARTLSGNLTVNGAMTATGAGDSIVLAAAQDFINTVGAGALDPGPGRWLVYSTSPGGSTENGLVGAAGSALPRLYNRTFAGDPPASITEPGNHLLYSVQPTLTVTPDNKSKVYGADDPVQTFVAAGFVNDDGVLDNAAIAGLGGSFARTVGESVGSRTITQGSFASGAGYGITFTGGQTLTITAAPLSATIADQTKTYGVDDPAPAGIGVTLGGLVNRTVATWNGNVVIDDSALTSSVTSLTRVAGENVGSYDVIAGTFSTPSANYGAPTLSGTPTLMITAAPLSFALATPGQTKVYGADDPALGGIGVTLTGLVNNPAIATWNGSVAVDDSTVTGTLASLTRAAGESVAGSPYAITAGAVTLSASDTNYVKSFDATNSPQLTIAQAPASVAANAQTKTYGASDPALTYVAAGLVSATVTDWNGNGTPINDSVAGVFSGGLVRAAGESVAGSPYAITQGTLAANANYSVASFTGENFTINPASLMVTADDATRPVGQPNPPFSATYSGFQFGESPAVLTGTLSYSTPATTGSPAGSYPITPWGQSSTNYVMSYVDGTLLVTGGSSTLPSNSIGDVATNLVVGGLERLGIGAASGHAVMCSDSSFPRDITVWSGGSAWSCSGRAEPVTLAATAFPKQAPPPVVTTAAPKPAPELAPAPTAAFRSSRALQYSDVMSAVQFRDPAAAIELLNLGLRADEPDDHGRTPLMAAAVNGWVAMTRLLLERGADPNRRAPGGSVLDFGRRSGNAEVIELLLRAGAR
jgi:hypothetical protein